MVYDIVTFKGYQGDERELEERLVTFLNLPPAKKVKQILSWTIGIEIYLMIIFGKGEKIEKEKNQELVLGLPPVLSYTGKGKGDY